MGSFGGRMRHWGRLALANPLAFVAAFTLGAFLSFAYSYVPLHTVKNRKLERLEETALAQEEQIAQLEAQVEGLEIAATEQGDDEALAKLEGERDAARGEASSARKELAKLKKKAGRLERDRNEWKRKVAKLEKQIAETPTTHIVELREEPATAAPGAASPAPVAGTSPPVADASAPAAGEPTPGETDAAVPQAVPASPAP